MATVKPHGRVYAALEKGARISELIPWSEAGIRITEIIPEKYPCGFFRRRGDNKALW